MKKTNRLLSIILAILMVMSIIPITASATVPTSGTCGDNVTWSFDEETYTLIISGTGNMYDYKSNNRPWIDYENAINKIVVEDGVTSISDYAFYNYTWVTDVDLPDTLVKIGNYALYGCSMTTINLADTLTTIGQYAFKNCDDLTDVVIPEGVTEIPTEAFSYNDQLVRLSLPSTLTTIYDFAFNGCSSLENIDIPDGVTSICGYAFVGCNSLKIVEIPGSVETISQSAFFACKGLEEVILHEGLKAIESGAFESCDKLVKINFPSTLKTLGSNVFRKTGFTTITIPTSITSFGAQIFAQCPNLTDVTFEDGVKFIAKEMFYNCSALKNVNIPSTVTTVRDNAFDSCSALENVYFSGTIGNWLKINFRDYAKSQPLYYAENLYFNNELVTEVIIPDNVTTINTYAFYNYDMLTSVKIPSTVKTINKSAFANCSGLTDLTIKEGILTLDSFVFSNCDALTGVTIPSSIKNIGTNVFEYCDALTKVVFAEGCTTTGVKTFYSCSALKEVVLPTSMNSISTTAFEYCNALTSIIVDNENQQYSSEDGVLFNKNKTTLILYPIGKPETSYTIPDGVTTLQKYAFENSILKSVVVPTSMSQIYGYAFCECDNFTDIYYKGTKSQWDAITKDDYYDEYLGEAIIHCGYPAGDYEYTVISETDRTIRIDKYNLYDSSTELVIPSVIDGYTVIEIGPSVFEGRTQFTNIVIPDSVTKIYERAFYNCTGLKKIEIPNSVTEISADAFYGCANLEKVLLNDCIKKIDIAAFNKCSSLNDVYYIGNEAQWNSITIDADNEPLISSTKHFEYTVDYVSDSGTCGDNLTWKFNAFTGTLTISGEGPMYDYSVPSWNVYGSEIENIVICEGVTSIGECAFYNCTTFTNISMADSVTTIGFQAFYNCNGLTDIVIGKGVKVLGYYTFYCCKSLKTITFDKNVKRIHQYVVGSCSNLTDVYYLGSSDDWCNTLVGYNCFWPGEIHILGNETHECTEEYIYDSVVTAPTCTENGYTTYFCRCGKTYADNYVDALGHTNADAIEENYIAPTTTKNGSKDIVVYCSVCNDEISRETLVVKYDENRHFTGVKGDYFYKDNVRQKAYQLVEFDGDFYFINDYNKIAKNKRIYLSQRFVEGFTFEDGTPLSVGYYEFDADGKMIINNGVVGDYFYINGVRQNAYQLIEFEGNYYFINDSHKVAKNKRLYMSAKFVEGTDLKVGYYEFDADGKMILKNGPDGDYFYINGVRQNAYQLIEFEGNYYFINDSHKLAKNKRLYMSQRFVEGTDLKVGYYEFDADGKMIIG